MDKKLERLYEQLGRIDSVIEKQNNQRLEKMKEIQQKREADKRAWMKEAGPVIDTFLLEAVGENYYYDITPANLTKAVRTDKLRTFARKEEKDEGKTEGNPAGKAEGTPEGKEEENAGEKTEGRSIAGKEGGDQPSSSSDKPGTEEPVKQKEEE